MKQGEIALSVIIPVFNVEKYVEDCIKSVLKQDYKNFEIIVVDDGSTDSSGKICKELARNNDKIKLICQENMGLSQARNSGMLQAVGEYVLFVDSDDVLIPNSLNQIMKFIHQKQPDFLKFGFKTIPQNYKIDAKNFSAQSVEIQAKISRNEMLDKLLTGKIPNYSWSFIAKKSIYVDNGITFPRNRLYEDLATSYRVIAASTTLYKMETVFYLYRQRNNSIANQHNSKIGPDILASLNEISVFFKNYFPGMLEKHWNMYVYFLLLAFYENSKTRGKDDTELFKNRKQLLKFYSLRKSKNISWKYFISLILVKFKIFVPIQDIRIGIKKMISRI
ncbi:glycosyltransferase family 2 protein [Pediococcus ethanolidurans]|uniref:Glycosyltransferase WchA n=1 Tax=Pediococcus ethanolidurans TaxID=319653 RepID=A0A0R2JWA5_9LACO|nr:glycosyltransferase family 2 protein [Pediococcus ethanolidurans]KRN81472.1 glycosyltransferase WchA [Pediococcus ethanolidurans]GEN95253.1 hypothetical protein PET01_13030 [Pediococcus ethanolidurans]SER60859.1 Glycosyltransferase involved in cell wall bisynthesis [Pediococcus ethanolidurans]